MISTMRLSLGELRIARTLPVLRPGSLQVLRFLAVGSSGAIAFVVLSTLVIGLRTGLPAWVASGLCYAALVPVVYMLHRRFSFDSPAPHTAAFPRYVAVQVSSVLLASLFSYIAYGTFRLPPPLASILVTGLVSGVNFVVLRIWAFPSAA